MALPALPFEIIIYTHRWYLSYLIVSLLFVRQPEKDLGLIKYEKPKAH
jgi:hypothetical protein